jgi:hypothetical protein
MKQFISILMTLIAIVAVRACNAGARHAGEPTAASLPTSSTVRAEILPDAALPAGYERHAISGIVTIDLPTSWQILDDDAVSNIREAAERVYGKNDTKKSLLAANSDEDLASRTASARINLLPDGLDVQSLQSATKTDLDELCSELPATMKTVGVPECSVTKIAGAAALLIEYHRIGSMPSTTWKVSLYQIPTVHGLLMVTLSKLSGSDEGEASISRIRDTLRIQDNRVANGPTTTAAAATPASHQERAGEAAPADMVLTTRMLDNPPGYEAVMSAPTHVSVCAGGTIVLSNGSNRAVNLEDVPNESDNKRALGTVKSGQVLRFAVDDFPAMYLIFEIDSGQSPLAAYEVKSC